MNDDKESDNNKKDIGTPYLNIGLRQKDHLCIDLLHKQILDLVPLLLGAVLKVDFVAGRARDRWIALVRDISQEVVLQSKHPFFLWVSNNYWTNSR